MDALVLEERLKEIEIKQFTKSKTQESKTEKMSYKEKIRFEEIQEVVESQESKVERIQSELDSFNYSAMDAEAKESLIKLQKKLDFEKKILDELFEEWSQLEEKAE